MSLFDQFILFESLCDIKMIIGIYFKNTGTDTIRREMIFNFSTNEMSHRGLIFVCISVKLRSDIVHGDREIHEYGCMLHFVMNVSL